MVQKDYIMRMIEQFAAILMKIVFNKENQHFDTALLEIDNAYRNLTGLDPKQIKSMSEQQIKNSISADSYLDVDRCIVIAELLREEAEIKELQNEHDEDSMDLFYKSLYLYIQAVLNTELYYQKKYAVKIEGIIEKISGYRTPEHCLFALFQYYEMMGKFGKAEDVVFELIENDYPGIHKDALKFYGRLLQKTDKELENGNLPRDEVEEELKKLEKIK